MIFSDRLSTAAARLALLAASALVADASAAQTAGPVRLSLGEAARLAARQNAGAEAAAYRSSEAEARVRQSRSALLPTFSVLGSDGQRTFNTASFGITLPSPPGEPPGPFSNPNGVVLGPVRLIDVRGRIAENLVDLSAIQRTRAARTEARATGADAADVAAQAASAAARAYLDVLRAEASLQARAADSLLAADLLGIARDQLRAGVGVALDVTRAQAQVAATRAQLIAARNDRNRARLELSRAVGLPLDTPIQLADSLAGLSASDVVPSEQEATERALRTRPDLRAADEQLRAARQQLTATRAERLPTLGAFADQGVTGIDYDHLLNTYTWGVQVSVPIFDGFRRHGREEEQRALTSEIDVRRRDLRQQAAVEVRRALLDLASAHEQVDAARERLRLAEQELDQARERFRAGVAGNADVISASLDLNNSRTFMIDALTAYQSARVALARAQGTVRELP